MDQTDERTTDVSQTEASQTNASHAESSPTEGSPTDESPVDATSTNASPTNGSPTQDARAHSDDEAARERERLARAVNELEAAKRRVERDAAAVQEETRAKLVSELLPVLDNFDRAIEVAEKHGDAPSVVEGMQLIRRQLATVLEGFGLVRFDAVGTPFDPMVHEAVEMAAVDDPSQNRMVVAQREPGYKFGDRLLRAAKVVVGKHG